MFTSYTKRPMVDFVLANLLEEVTMISKEEKSWTFVPIKFKNSASGFL
jgi:hypothetical protein